MAEGVVTIAGVYADATFSADGSKLYAVSGNHVYVISVANGTITATFTVGNALGAIDVSIDGRYLAVVEEQPNGGSGILYTIDLSLGSISTVHVQNATALHDVAFLSNWTVVVSQEASGAILQVNLTDGTSGPQLLDVPGNSTLIGSGDGTFFLAQPADVTWSIYYMDYGQGIGGGHFGNPDPYAGASVPPAGSGVGAVSANGDLVVQGMNLNVYSLDAQDVLNTVFSLGSKFPYLVNPAGLAFNSDGSRLFLLTSAGTIVEFNTTSWDVVASYAGSAATSSASPLFPGYGDLLQISADGDHLSVITPTGIELIDLSVAAPIAGGGADDLSGAGALFGFGGNDLLTGTGPSFMYGGTGDDTYYVSSFQQDIFELTDEGHDTIHSSVSFALGDNEEDLFLTGTATVNGSGNSLDNMVTGNSAANALSGGTGNDTLRGSGGNDTLDGGIGADRMYGGIGNDTYYVEVGSDSTIELAGEGTDLVVSMVNRTLGANLENLTLGGAANIYGKGNELANVVTGNSGANSLFGLAGNDTLQGASGNDVLDGGIDADKMYGGAGNDSYLVDSTSDRVFENAAEGTDKVTASVSFTLSADVENLTLSGTSASNGTGNAIANVLTGNDSVNRLYGMDGNDTLRSNGGNDVVDGGVGGDKMYGGIGNDTYIVDNSQDRAIESDGEGTDTVKSSVTFTLGNNLENLTLTGTSAITGKGNELANIVVGNGAANHLFGFGGADTLKGGGGADSVEGGSARDVVTGGTGADLFIFRDGDFGGATKSTADKIVDFNHAEGDSIDLHLVDSKTAIDGNQGFTFIGSESFHHIAGELRYQEISGNTFVYGDTNGDGLADFMIRLDGSHALVSGDFLL